MKGVCSSEYVANETPMHTYINIHLALERRRNDAAKDNSQGPKVKMVQIGVKGSVLMALIFCHRF
jgi:polyribonucleotide 5'-hydroxyl-kinase